MHLRNTDTAYVCLDSKGKINKQNEERLCCMIHFELRILPQTYAGHLVLKQVNTAHASHVCISYFT